MQRRDIKRGAHDARDRARHRTQPVDTRLPSEPLTELGVYLEQMDLSNSADLDLYARQTSHIDLSLGERLRQLAVHLECDRSVHRWSVLEPVYTAALKANPDHSHTWSSWALARWHTDAPTQEVMEACVASSRRAVALAPGDGHLHGILGQLLYQAGELNDAEEVLRRAIKLGHGCWPHVWLAHTLHDQQQWNEAAEAYAAIPASEMPARGSWRIQLARQQRAACLHRAGRRNEALEQYLEVLTRYERALDAGLDSLSSPVLAFGPPDYLLTDLDAFPELQERTDKLKERLNAHADTLLHID